MKALKVFEKFTEESDPIHDLHIGAKYKNFQNTDEMHNYIVSILPKILHKRKIPEDILNQWGHYIREKYHKKIDEYVNKYFTINNSKINYKEDFLFSKLLDHDESLKINEKFIEESDPIRDLGIGSKFAKIQKGDIIKPKKDLIVINHNIVFDSSLKTNMPSSCYAVISDIEKLQDNLKLTLIFITSLDSAMTTRKYYEKEIYIFTYGEADIETWEKYFKVVYQNNKLIERFTEDSYPIKDLGIGSINFAEKASETFNNKKDEDRLLNWLEYLDSLIGKRITGKFKFKEEEKSFIIKDHQSYLHGNLIYFLDKKKVSYQVDNDNRYIIS